MNRYFIAIEIPEKTKDDIFSFFYPKLEHDITGNFVNKEKFHITVLFLGDIEIRKDLPDFIKTIKFSTLLKVRGIDAFPSIENPKTVYAKVYGDLKEPLRKLYSFLSVKENKEFTPHITLCRAKKVTANINKKEFESSEFLFTADSLHLFNSDFADYYKII